METMKSEIDFMHSNQIWSLVNTPEGIIHIECKWIYKKTIGLDGKLKNYKVRLVMNDYNQRERIDYHEIFSSVVILKSIHTLLAIAAFHDYEI